MDRVIEVVGRGAAAAPADCARVLLSAVAEHEDVSSALGLVGQIVAELGASLRAHGVEARDIAAQNVNVSGEYGPDGRPTGRQVAQYALTVTVRDLDQVGAVIGAAVGRADNRVRLDSLTLGIADTRPLEAQARDAAFADARERAAALAALAGAGLGAVVSVREGTSSGGGASRIHKLDAAMASLPVETGEQSVDVALIVTFALA